MFKKLLIVLVFSAFIIPQISEGIFIPWKVWLDFYPELREIVRCESNFNPKAIGDHGKSFGIFQIHLPAHSKITKTQALDPYWSLNWAIEKFNAGELGIWSCWKIVKTQGLFDL